MTTPSGVLQAVAAQLRDALDPLDLDALSALLDGNVRWGGNQDTHDHDHEWIVYQALRVDGQRIVDIRGCPNRYLAATRAGVPVEPVEGTRAESVTPRRARGQPDRALNRPAQTDVDSISRRK